MPKTSRANATEVPLDGVPTKSGGQGEGARDFLIGVACGPTTRHHYRWVPVTELGGSRPLPTPAEGRFLDGFGRSVEFDCDVWLHEDEDGTPWMIVSLDFTEAGSIRKTLRLDFDARTIRGGWSPACLNWDGGVRAEEAAIDCAPPDGIYAEGESVEALAQAAADWFRYHRNKE